MSATVDLPPQADVLLAGALLLEEAAAHMDAHDAATDGAFPRAAWTCLERAGVLAALAAPEPPSVSDELRLIRQVSAADVSLGRLLDGHANAVQRLRVQVPVELAADDLRRAARGPLVLGVWGADPGPGEGPPARLRESAAGAVTLDGVKAFCSGAGGVERAFVAVRGPDDDAPTRLAYVDVTHAEVDRGWYRGAGMRGSASHAVRFASATVLWTAPEPGALLRQPWFAQDGLRTAAGWAGGADAVAAETLRILHEKGAAGEDAALGVARLAREQRALDLWLAEGARAVAAAAQDDAPAALGAVAETTLLARAAIAASVTAILDESARLVGSRPFAAGGRLERAHRDLRTYLLQHRLEPALARLGAGRLAHDSSVPT